MLKIFLSHSSKNAMFSTLFSQLLESLSSDIYVFCSSEEGSLNVGEDFVSSIFKELDSCDIFIPLISHEYYESKFCMIELGVAYSYFYNKFQKQGDNYILPLVLPPTIKNNALSGTPLSHIQTGELNSKEDLNRIIQYLKNNFNITILSGLNQELHKFKFNVDKILLEKQNIVKIAKIETYFDDQIDYTRRSDIVNHSFTKNGISVNYNLNPKEKDDVKKPNFISLVLKYIDKINLSRYLDFSNNVAFKFVLLNFTNSIKKINIEFKYGDFNKILDTFEIDVQSGTNVLSIPIISMQSKALREITEICFVIRPEDITENEGMFNISNITIM